MRYINSRLTLTMTLTNIMLLCDGSVPTNAELRPGSDSIF